MYLTNNSNERNNYLCVSNFHRSMLKKRVKYFGYPILKRAMRKKKRIELDIRVTFHRHLPQKMLSASEDLEYIHISIVICSIL